MTSRDEQYKRLSESRNRKPESEFALWTKADNEDWCFRMLFNSEAGAQAKGQEWAAGKFCKEYLVSSANIP